MTTECVGAPTTSNFHSVLLTQNVLAERWCISTKKLEADRLKGCGCPYIKIGSSVRYRLSDVLDYEQANLRRSTSEHGGR